MGVLSVTPYADVTSLTMATNCDNSRRRASDRRRHRDDVVGRVVSLLTGARTEELRTLTWDHVDFNGKSDDGPWCHHRSPCGGRSGRERTPRHVSHGESSHCQDDVSRSWGDNDGSRTRIGTPLDPSHVRREFPNAIRLRCRAGRYGVDTPGSAAQFHFPAVQTALMVCATCANAGALCGAIPDWD